ncbi:protein JTB-like [Tubulanus polymorphus]|uniref:protein JTB-like n=1 Tax=Tubulanus polymorphus TaxID=672921 RepID=UPI003DA1F9C2
MVFSESSRATKVGHTLRIIAKMIEWCTKKRMIAGIVLLVIVSVLVLVIESSLYIRMNIKDVTKLPKDKNNKNSSNDYCWLHEQTQVLTNQCAPCTKLEMKMNMEPCKETGYKVPVICEKTGKVFRSCQKPRDAKKEEMYFWIFEASTFVIGIVSYCVVRVRQRKLDKQLLDRINKQISSGI